MTRDIHYKILDETEELILGYLFEDAYLTVKATGGNTKLGTFYGDPVCGLIDSANNWCIVGGAILVLWTKDNIISVSNEDLSGVYDLRQTGNYKVQLLLDPWADNAAVWEFDVTKKVKSKIKDFPDYRDKAYTDKVAW